MFPEKSIVTLVLSILSLAASLAGYVPGQIEDTGAQEEQELQDMVSLSGEKDENIDNQGNAYFYEEGETVHTYEGYFYLHSYTELWQDHMVDQE